MWRILSIVRQNLCNIRKSPRVADEHSFSGGRDAVAGEEQVFVAEGGNAGGLPRPRISSVLYGVIIRAPLSVLSACLVQPPVGCNNGADIAWTSGDSTRASEMNQLVVSDSIRYALLM
ncbi:hypothetical protein SAY86_011729 [Trapa natans]|uniref:Uncharacterized protein n=1 Tax=Trapa natans TaxID=22666 RepID=A0AAN7LZS8_TRANT|nr:hypothetical protein SAY86_011729 [Trapa natans]